MKKVRAFIENLSRRERVILFALIPLVGISIIYFTLIVHFFAAWRDLGERIATQEMLLTKYRNLLSKEKDIKDHLRLLEKNYTSISQRLYSASTEELANAKIQSDVKGIAQRNGLSVSRSMFQKKELLASAPHLVSMSVNIEIEDINSASKLQKFLYDVESNTSRFLFFDDLQISTRGFDTSSGLSLSATLVTFASIEGKP